MLSTTSLTLVLIAITLIRIYCQECEDAKERCSSLKDLNSNDGYIVAWKRKKCTTNSTILDQAEIGKYKECIRTHLLPCLTDKEDVAFKILFVDSMDKYDLGQVCTPEVQRLFEDHLVHVYMDHKEILEKRVILKCSMMKRAMEKIKECSGV